MTQRVTDVNGWYEVKRNPLSRVGVFPYSGRSVGLKGADADRIVRVYRPAEELSDPECLDSFKLIPWVDEHTMLGPDDAGNVMAAESKGVQGVIGEDVVFDGGVLYGNIKVFSNSMARLIDAGKRQLSAGYRCVYDFTPGVFDGQAYDAVQRKIRGNHLALVGEGRMGPSVAVQDSMTFTFDAQEALPMADPTQTPPGGQPPGGNPNPPGGAHNDPTSGGVDPNNPAAKLTIAEIGAIMTALVPMLANVQKLLGSLGGAVGVGGAANPQNADPNNPHPNLNPQPKPGEGDGKNTPPGDGKNTPPGNPNGNNPEDENAMDAALKAEVETLKTTVAGLADTVKNAVATMDAALKAAPTAATVGAEVAARDKLADRIGAVVGTFDAKDKTLQGVAEYGVEKLGLANVAKGMELSAVDAYLQGVEKHAKTTAVRLPGAGLDAATVPADNFVSRQINATPATK